MVIYAAVQEVLFLRQLLANLAHPPSGSTRMPEDNNGCKEMATNDMTTAKSKHIGIRYHFIREVVKSKAVVIQYCPSKDMLADALTKFSLPIGLHLKLVNMMLIGTYPGPPV
jgi:hypothetical protein